MWYKKSVFYQIYPLGFCGAPEQNDGVSKSRIGKITGWIPHLKKLGVGAVVFNPLFESDAHGYDTRDYTKVDVRLGTNAEFAKVCEEMHSAGLKVVLDGVFNHVGRGFWAFLDVKEKRQDSRYKDWFHLDFGRDSNYGDGFWYDGWEGHYELVRLNLQNNELVAYLLDCVKNWVQAFDIDGLRLDVAYCLTQDFMKQLRSFVDVLKPEFYLVGEMLHGDYKSIVNDEMLHSATNYECYKGLHSSLNTLNFFEIAHSLNRQFGPEDWTLYKDISLFNFVDNHDVTRAASVLDNPGHLPLLYGMLLGMPGVPCLYYGSEWGARGDKENGSDAGLRADFEKPVENDTFRMLAKMCAIYNESKALQSGEYRQVYVTNKQLIFERKSADERYLLALNADEQAHTVHFDAGAGMAMERITEEKIDFGGGFSLPGMCVMILQMER